MNFELTTQHKRIQAQCRELATDFATRAAEHDREASNPVENYVLLREAGFHTLNIPTELGGWGEKLFGHSLALEQLAQGCPATALSFNMHLAWVGYLMENIEIASDVKQRVADWVVQGNNLVAGSTSEASTSALLASYAPATQARPVDGGYVINGKKFFSSMVGAADFRAVPARREDATTPGAAIVFLVPRDAPGQTIEQVWDVLGMRGTRSDCLLLEDCFVPEESVVFDTDNFFPSIARGANWFWASYTAVYLGVAAAIYAEILKVVQERVPKGFTQAMAYHPDVRRKIAEMNADLESARLSVYHSAWLSDAEGPTQNAIAALYRAKYLVGEATARIGRNALTLGGAHTLFKSSPLERLFRDGTVGAIQFPPSDFCLSSLGSLELDLDPHEIPPPMK